MEEFCKSIEDSRWSSAQDNEGMSYFLINRNPHYSMTVVLIIIIIIIMVV